MKTKHTKSKSIQHAFLIHYFKSLVELIVHCHLAPNAPDIIIKTSYHKLPRRSFKVSINATKNI